MRRVAVGGGTRRRNYKQRSERDQGTRFLSVGGHVDIDVLNASHCVRVAAAAKFGRQTRFLALSAGYRLFKELAPYALPGTHAGREGAIHMFDVNLELRVTVTWKDNGFPARDAVVYIHMRGDLSDLSPESNNKWHVVGRLDHRLSHIGLGVNRWRAEKTVRGDYLVVLETAGGRRWARLLDFPEMPNINSWGRGFALYVPVPQNAVARTNLQWGVRINVPQPHLDSQLDRMTTWSYMLRPSGWNYESSGGGSASGIFGIGLSHAKGNLKFKRGGESVQVDYEMAGAGIGLPGGGYSDSSTFDSWGTQVYCSPLITGQMKAADFEGGIVALDLGAGGGAGGASVSGDYYWVLFTDKVRTSVVVANPVAWKAAFTCWGPSGGVGTPGLSGPIMAYNGVANLHRP
jgi:hypothetical protein